MSITRRNFLQGSAASAALAALAGCSNGSSGDAIEAASYPLDAEEWGSGTPKYTVEKSGDNWVRVTNEDGAVLGIVDESKLIQVDGYAFKDFNGNGKLDLWEDWRQEPGARAAALTDELEEEELLHSLMLEREMYITGNIGATVDDKMKELMDYGFRNTQGGYFFKGGAPAGAPWARWSNRLQEYCEGSHMGLPVHVYCDPFNVPGTEWPSTVGLAASFDPQIAWNYGYYHSREWRALGIHSVLGPQMDTATEPRWSRAEGTFGEDPALSRDMAKASVSALQSTWDGSDDKGWGKDSVAAMIKHWPGDGAGMFGWESHQRAGRYSVFPEGHFPLQTIPFVDGALQLDSVTGRAAAVMPSYTIAFDEDEKWGENVGSAYSEYKLSLLREKCDFDGLVCTDWQVVDDGFHTWGVDDLTPAERVCKGWKAGVDQWGGQNDPNPVFGGYELLKKDLGEDEALAKIRTSSARVFKNTFTLGLFENPYLEPEESRAIVDENEDGLAAAHEAGVKGIVMLKNAGGTIAKAEGDKKLTAYVPKVFTASSIRPGRDGAPDQLIPSTFELPLDQEVLEQYFNLVTDSLTDVLTGDPDDDGNPMITQADIVRATPEQLATCDMAVVFVQQPQNAHNADGIDENGNYIPVSMVYRPYTATAEGGCPEQSPAGDPGENLSPIGNTSMITNESDLDSILDAKAAMPESAKVVVCINSNKAGMIPSEFEPQVDAILYGFKSAYVPFLDIITGKEEPSGLLPLQLPASMKEVETQASDTPRDMECYVDTEGNAYDFAFGLNWSGVIDDDRVKTYKVDPILMPETIEF